MKTVRIFALVLAMAFVLMLVGCGDSGTAESATSSKEPVIVSGNSADFNELFNTSEQETKSESRLESSAKDTTSHTASQGLEVETPSDEGFGELYN